MGDLEQRFPFYDKLLRLYPKPYREQYGAQMLQTLADMLDAEPEHKTSIWFRAIVELPFSLTKQQLLYAGGIMTHQMPHYVKRNAVVSAALLVPFALALIANGLDTLLRNHTLYHSWLWQMPILTIWVLWLPILAALLALVSLLIFFRERSQQERYSFKQLFDIHHTWPLLAPALAALFIIAMVFGHDSVHCVTGNPVHEIHNWHQTWQCIQQR